MSRERKPRQRKHAERNAAIVAAVVAGEGYQVVAERYGLSRQRVEQIVTPSRHRARRLVFEAVSAGQLVRPGQCDGCQRVAETEAHHDDYARPLDVIWLCLVCHRKAHAAKGTRRHYLRFAGYRPSHKQSLAAHLLRRLRITHAEWTARLDVDEPLISAWYSGRRRPSDNSLIAILVALVAAEPGLMVHEILPPWAVTSRERAA